MRWVSAAAFFEVLNCAEAEGRLGAYAIKGGFAVELRHNAAARTSEDIDLILAGEHQAIEILRNIYSRRAIGTHSISVRTRTERDMWCRMTMLAGESSRVELQHARMMMTRNN